MWLYPRSPPTMKQNLPVIIMSLSRKIKGNVVLEFLKKYSIFHITIRPMCFVGFRSTFAIKLLWNSPTSVVCTFTWSSIEKVGSINFIQTASELRLCVCPHGYLGRRSQWFLNSMRAPCRSSGESSTSTSHKEESKHLWERQRNWLPEEHCFSVHDKLLREMHGLHHEWCGKFCCQWVLVQLNTKGP